LRFNLLICSLCFIHVYGQKSRALHPERFQRVVMTKPNASSILSGDFNAHVENDVEVQKGVLGRHGDDDVNENRRLQPWASEWGGQGGFAPFLDFEIFRQEGCFLSFEREKTNSTTFAPPWKESFRRPCMQLCCNSAL